MDRFARVVLGYHGCEREYADALLSGEVPVSDWKPSENPYDWLGHGVYFWEHAPERARAWARSKKRPAVVGAVIQLGLCLDLTDIGYTDLLAGQYRSLKALYLETGRTLPRNRKGRNDLDCLVINELVAVSGKAEIGFQTVRCPFLEGQRAFPGSEIRRESHIQVAVVDLGCILGVFRPNLIDR